MSARDSADAQLERILYILPTAAREGGATFDELARALDANVETVIADIERVTSRAYYHPAGSVDKFSVLVHGDRVHVHAPHEFRRPARLSSREALALSLGLRVLASEADGDRAAAILALARRLEARLEVPGTAPDASVEYDPDAQAEMLLDVGADDARGTLADAIAMRRRCTIAYLKPGTGAPADRRVEPHVLVYNDGRWYVVGRDVERDARRVFRLDRVLAVRIDDTEFDMPERADALSLFRDGVGPFAAEREDEVVVRYSSRIARWIAERTGEDVLPDGSVRVTHRVADPRWIVSHVLQYGGDAVLEDPRLYRRMVEGTARRIAS